MVTFKKEGYTPLAVREDADGKLWVKAKARGDIDIKEPAVITGETCGWGSHTISLATATSAWVYIGFALATQSTGDYAWYQVGGYCSNCLYDGSVSSSAGIGVAWASASIASHGSAASSSLAMGRGIFGMTDTNDEATTNHDIFLFGQMVVNSGA